MPGVGDGRRAAGQHPRIVRLHVGVCAEHGRRSAVQIPRERDLLARRLGVEVDDDDRRGAQGLLDEAIGGEERRLERVEREDAEQADHRNAVVDGEADARRVRRHVRGAEHPVGSAQIGRESGLAPGPVAERDHVGARGEQPIGELRRDPAPRGGVLAVDDAEVGFELGAE